MIVFLAAAATLVLACLAWIVRPLLADRSGRGVSSEASNLSILLDQLRELNADLANGALSAEQHAKARQEIEQRALEETGEASSAQLPTSRASRVTAAVIAATLPIAAALLYLAFGNPGALVSAGPSRAPTGVPEHVASADNAGRMAEVLAKRLENQPNDAAGWTMLARTYAALKRLPEAAAAFERAVSLAPDDPDVLVDYADVLAASNGGRLDGKPLELITRALRTNPWQWKGLLLAGKAAFDRKDYRRALADWERARASLPADSPIAPAIDASIARARQLTRTISGADATPPRPPTSEGQ